MRHYLVSGLFVCLTLLGGWGVHADDLYSEPQVKTGTGDYVLHASNRIVFRIHTKTGQTYLLEHREWKAVIEPGELPSGDYDLLLTSARTITEVFRIDKKTGATWGLGHSDTDPKREKPRWFPVTENLLPLVKQHTRDNVRDGRC